MYKIGNEMPMFENGVIFFLFGMDTEYSDAEYKMTFVDDKNRPEPTLGRRRLAMQAEGKTLKKLSSAIFFIGDFLKLAKARVCFIDSAGRVFEYKKTVTVKLVFKRITEVIRLPAGGAIICVQGMNTRFKVLFAPTDVVTHAGLLVLSNSYILYGIYTKQHKDTTRKI